jgi:hypothetical protein
MDLRQLHITLKRIEDELPSGEFPLVVSIENRANRQNGGIITDVTRAMAARLIHARTHRLATDEEAAAHLASETQAREESRHARLAPRIAYRGSTIVLPPAAVDEQPKKKSR